MNNNNLLIIGGIIIVLLLGGIFAWQGGLFTAETNVNDNEPNATTTIGNDDDNDENVPEEMEIEIAFIDVDDGGERGRLIGCNDSVVLASRTVDYSEAPLRAALEELLSLTEANDPQTELYNALYQSDLTIDTVGIVDGTATIELSGDTRIGGVCDEPRFEEQLRETALQFETVDTVEIFINNESLEEVFSAQ